MIAILALILKYSFLNFFLYWKGWTETYVRWSPQGTYLATFHKQGIALWGGDEYNRIGKFGHQGVQMIDFSPCERYDMEWENLYNHVSINN